MLINTLSLTVYPCCAGHWKLGHTPKNFVLSQVVILAQMSLFTFTRTAPGLFESFGFIKEQPVFMSIVLFQLLQGPIDEVRTRLLHAPSQQLPCSCCTGRVSLHLGLCT